MVRREENGNNDEIPYPVAATLRRRTNKTTTKPTWRTRITTAVSFCLSGRSNFDGRRRISSSDTCTISFFDFWQNSNLFIFFLLVISCLFNWLFFDVCYKQSLVNVVTDFTQLLQANEFSRRTAAFRPGVTTIFFIPSSASWWNPHTPHTHTHTIHRHCQIEDGRLSDTTINKWRERSASD